MNIQNDVFIFNFYSKAGRTLHPYNMAAGPASYCFTDTMGIMHSDAQFAVSEALK